MNKLEKMENGRTDKIGPPQVKSSRHSSSPSTPPDYKPGVSIGRIKAPPVCKEHLKRESLSAAQLSKFCFTPKDAAHMGSLPSVSQNETETQWESIMRQISNCETSRNGRENQRFAADARTGKQYRLTTGTVPIMTDGRILLCSSSRRDSWILPKGGWENDEILELSALRETFEELGVLGTLGPKLNLVEYETRKAKKRRLEMELQKSKQARKTGMVSVVSASSSCGISSEDEHNSAKAIGSDNCGETQNCEAVSTSIADEVSSVQVERFDDTASVASFASFASDVSSSCTHCRMYMTVLYVSEAREQWPESGRARKIVHIDEAIKMMSTRPEFEAVLIEVKRKGYHLAVGEGKRISLGCEDDLIDQSTEQPVSNCNESKQENSSENDTTTI